MQLRHLELGDDPDDWRSLGFDVDPGGAVVLGSTVITLTGRGGGFRGWWIEGVDSPIDGIACSRPVWNGRPPSPAPHPNGIVSIDHVVILTDDLRRTIGALEEAGMEMRRERTTTMHGSAVRQGFFWAGDVILEVVGPEVADPASTGPAGLFGLSFVSDDLDATADSLGPRMGPPKDAVQEGRRIAGLRCGGLGVSVPLAVMSPHPR
jgi:hypothetical protein